MKKVSKKGTGGDDFFAVMSERFVTRKEFDKLVKRFDALEAKVMKIKK